MMPRGGIFLGKWLSTFVGSSDGKMNVQSACALNTGIKTNCLMQFRETTAVYSGNNREHTLVRSVVKMQSYLLLKQVVHIQ
jgi:hypothetical protein